MSRQQDKLLKKFRGKGYTKNEGFLFRRFSKVFKKSIGSVSDTRCKATYNHPITRKACRTRCKEWDGSKCCLGY